MKTIILFLFCSVLYAQKNKELRYKLLDKYELSDFNNVAIDSIDSASKGVIMLDSVFNVVKGKYSVYRFITKEEGILFDDYRANFNNLIILKVNSNGMIIDGYKYFLQNPEMPSRCYLYRISRKKILKPMMMISQLRFKRIHKDKVKGFNLCEGSILSLKDNGYLVM